MTELETWQEQNRREHEEHQQWLDSLSVGDSVALYNGWHYTLQKVERITPTQVIVCNTKYRKENGRPVGASGYSQSRLVIPTPEVLATIKRRARISALEGVKWRDEPDEVLEAVLAALR